MVIQKRPQSRSTAFSRCQKEEGEDKTMTRHNDKVTKNNRHAKHSQQQRRQQQQQTNKQTTTTNSKQVLSLYNRVRLCADAESGGGGGGRGCRHS